MSEQKMDFLYDPEEVRPNDKLEYPIGTLQEIKDEGLDPAVVPCCHRKVVGGDGKVVIEGCPFRVQDGEGVLMICQLPIRDVAGPQNFGVKYRKGAVHGGATIRAERDCFWIARNKRAAEQNGGMVKIIAREGETFQAVTIGPPGYRPQQTPVEVKKYPRPKDNPDVAEAILTALEKADQEKEKAEQRGEADN